MRIEKKAYAKINLGLDVTGKRDDGYHIVRMIMQNVNLFDTLTFEDNDTGEIVLTASSEKIPTDDSNLICKVKFLVTTTYKIGISSMKEIVPNSRTHKSVMPGYIYLTILTEHRPCGL